MKILILIVFTASPSLPLYSQSADYSNTAYSLVSGKLLAVSARSFPEIKTEKLKIKLFHSESNFFKARFSICRYLTFQRMRHNVYVNPVVLERKLPEVALEAVLAHELSHVAYYTRKNRFELLGLVRLLNGKATVEFERKADLDAIGRGFGEGLIAYRRWLYQQISPKEEAAKRKIYFSPAEIELIMRALHEKPELFASWKKNVPLSIEKVRKDAGYD